MDTDSIELSDKLTLGDNVLVRNNINTIDSLVSMSKIEIDPTKPTCDAILNKFESFKSLTTQYHTEVQPREHGKDVYWRRYLTSSEKRRFQIMKRVINAFEGIVHSDTSKSRDEVASVFEEYYQCNKHDFVEGIISQGSNR